MRCAFVSAVVLGLCAAAAQASTLRIDVVGTASGQVRGDYSFDTTGTGSMGGWSLDMAALTHLPVATPHLAFLEATTGSAIYDSDLRRFSDCGGLLAALCSQGYWTNLSANTADNAFTLSGGNGYQGFWGNESRLTFGFDAVPTFHLNGVLYLGAPGLTLLHADFTEVAVAAVPLPAGALLLLTGLGALGLSRARDARRRGADAA